MKDYELADEPGLVKELDSGWSEAIGWLLAIGLCAAAIYTTFNAV